MSPEENPIHYCYGCQSCFAEMIDWGNELPGMWEAADLTGGFADAEEMDCE